MKVIHLMGRLRGDETPVFGIMTPQHMIEHLALVVRFSNGKEPQQLHTPMPMALKIKAHVVYTEHPLQPGYKSPVLPKDELLPLVHHDITEALATLGAELDDLHAHFALHPADKPMNPVMGALDHAEWIAYHNKHFTHHLRQFALIDPVITR